MHTHTHTHSRLTASLTHTQKTRKLSDRQTRRHPRLNDVKRHSSSLGSRAQLSAKYVLPTSTVEDGSVTRRFSASMFIGFGNQSRSANQIEALHPVINRITVAIWQIIVSRECTHPRFKLKAEDCGRIEGSKVVPYSRTHQLSHQSSTVTYIGHSSGTVTIVILIAHCRGRASARTQAHILD